MINSPSIIILDRHHIKLLVIMLVRFALPNCRTRNGRVPSHAPILLITMRMSCIYQVCIL